MKKMFVSMLSMISMLTLAVSLAACCPTISPEAGEGLTRIAAATDLVAVYALDGGTFSPVEAGWSEGAWNQKACVGSMQMHEVMVALHEVGLPYIVAVSAGEEVEPPPPREPPDYEAACRDIENAGPS